MQITLDIPGKPLAQARPRLIMRNRKEIVYDSQSKERAYIKSYLLHQMDQRYPDWDWPIAPVVSFVFYMPIPKAFKKTDLGPASQGLMKHLVKPDVDNLVKLYLDALNGIAWEDDSCVSLGSAIKFYHREPRTIISIVDSSQMLSVD